MAINRVDLKWTRASNEKPWWCMREAERSWGQRPGGDRRWRHGAHRTAWSTTWSEPHSSPASKQRRHYGYLEDLTPPLVVLLNKWQLLSKIRWDALWRFFFKLLVNSSFFVKPTNFLDKLAKLVWNRAIAIRLLTLYSHKKSRSKN